VKLTKLSLLLFILGTHPTAQATDQEPTTKKAFTSVDCESAPKNAVLNLSSPINQWALIFCSPKGHTVAPGGGYIWNDPDGKVILIHANLKESPKTQHGGYFTNQRSRTLTGETLDDANKMLEVNYKLTPTYKDVHQLEIISSQGFGYHIFFYLKGDLPEYVLVCVNKCRTDTLILLKQSIWKK